MANQSQQHQTQSPELSDSERYEGHAEYEFVQAFYRLCEEAGGFRKGSKLAQNLIKEQVQ